MSDDLLPTLEHVMLANLPAWSAMPPWLVPDPLAVEMTLKAARVRRRRYHNSNNKSGEQPLLEVVEDEEDAA